MDHTAAAASPGAAASGIQASAPAAAFCSVRTPLARQLLAGAALLAAVLPVRLQAVQQLLLLRCWSHLPGWAAGLVAGLWGKSGQGRSHFLVQQHGSSTIFRQKWHNVPAMPL